MDIQIPIAGGSTFEDILSSARTFTGCTKVRNIGKGFSFERKYLLSGNGTRRYLVRITTLSDPCILTRKKEEFELIHILDRYSGLVPKARSFGISSDGSACYMVLDYIEGTDAQTALHRYRCEEQYRLGAEAGRVLKKLHALPAPPGLPDWSDAVTEKYSRKVAAFERRGLELQGIDRAHLSGYIRKTLPCIRGTGRTFLHDDYHPANLILHERRLSGIIDFNRYDWGDPVHDFVKAAFFSRAISIPFAVGQIDGYHDGSVPSLFWQKYSLYCAMTLIPDVLWAHDYAEKTGLWEETRRSEARIRTVCSDHEEFTTDIPLWYQEYREKRDE